MTSNLKRRPVAKGSALAEMVAEVEAHKEPLVLEEDGRAVAALVSVEYLEEILSHLSTRAEFDVPRSGRDRALAVGGAWKDVKGIEELIEYVHRARHDSPPSPPVDI